MAFLPEDVRSQQRVLGIVLLVGAAALFHLYVRVPHLAEAADLRQRIEELGPRSGAAPVGTDDLDRTRDGLERAQRLLEALQETMPRDADVADIYQEIAARSEALGLELVSVEPSRQASSEGASYPRLRWDVSLEGRYHDLGRLLAEVASLPRIVRPSVRSVQGLGRTEEGRYPVRAEIALETFLLGVGGGQPIGIAGSPTGSLAGRETPARSAVDSLLPYEREPFVYPGGGRPNPFRPSTATGGAGPRFEDLRLSGILYAPAVGSVAVLRDASTGRIHRLREGDRVGNARLVELRPSDALFLVTESAGSRRRVLRVDPDRGPGERP